MAHVLGALAAGGAERLVVELLPALASHGYAPLLLRLSPRLDAAGEAMSVDLDAAGIPHRAGPSRRVGLRSVVWLGRELARARPALVHLHNLNAEMAYLLARPWMRFEHRTVRTVHNTVLDAPLLARLGFRTNPVAATIFCGNAAAQQGAAIFRGLSEVIPNAVRFDWPPTSPALRERARDALGWSAEGAIFLSVGRMDGPSLDVAQKAHDVLLRAWRASEPRNRGDRLVLIGDGPLRPELEALAGGDPSVTFLGLRSDVRLWLQATDVFVMPSRFEGLPIAGLEGVGSGLRCVFSQIESLRELNAPRVVWCEPGDVPSLVRALDRVRRLDPPTARQVEDFRSRFGMENLARRHADLYARVLGGPPAAPGTGC